MYPEGKLTASKMKEVSVKIKVIEGENMPHIWPFLPVMKEAKQSLRALIGFLNSKQ